MHKIDSDQISPKQMAPVYGRICSIEIPAANPAQSAEFYQKVFGWTLHPVTEDRIRFEDSSQALSGAFVQRRTPAETPGILLYIQVESVAKAANAVMAAGGDIVQRIGVDAPEITARFRDPAGNVIGLYQERKPSL
jgi:predicted enzyme related to lactoylglutathione lyase